ncbi:MAG TPA: hypothetical protein VMT64_03505 [Candidatus Binataceae bacterium]|nr:hypothetical protein [Candidatus Binataceae bacterium]
MKLLLISAAALAAAIAIPACGVKSPPIPPQEAVPERIVGLTATAQKNGVLLSWERPDRTAGGHTMRDLGSFEIDRAEDIAAFAQLVRLPITDNDRFQQQRQFTYLDAGAQIGRHYRYRIISSTLDHYRSDPSNAAEITYEKPKPPPNPEDFVIPQPKPLP